MIPTPDRWRGSDPVRILFIAANPLATSRLDLPGEFAAIARYLRDAELADRFELRAEWAVQRSELVHHLLRHRPNIVHFSGHRDQDGILLRDADGRPAHVSPDALTQLLATFADTVRCVILNVCDSLAQADQLAERIDCAIGMDGYIKDSAARAFSTAFYSALAFGESVARAFQIGCRAIEVNGHGCAEMPTLKTNRRADTSGMFFAGQHRQLNDPRIKRAIGHLIREQDADPWMTTGFAALTVEAVDRLLDRIRRAFDPARILSPMECDLLTVAAFVRALEPRSEVDRLTSALAATGIRGLDQHASTSLRIAELADHDGEIGDPFMDCDDVRVGLLAAVLRVGAVLTCDREALAKRQRVPGVAATPRHWSAYLTREIRIPCTGVVSYVIEIPAESWARPVKWLTALQLEVAWQTLRHILAPAGLALTVAPCEVILGSLAKPDPEVLERLCGRAAEIRAALPAMPHLGEPILADLLPLPRSAILDRIEFHLTARPQRRVVVWQPYERAQACDREDRDVVIDDAELLTIEPDARDRGVLHAAQLAGHGWHDWHLERDDGLLEPTIITHGQVRRLSNFERLLWRIDGATTPPDARAAVQETLGLWNDLVAELWPRVNQGTISLDNHIRLYRVLRATTEYLLDASPHSPWIDIYRDATNRVRHLLDETEQEIGGNQ